MPARGIARAIENLAGAEVTLAGYFHVLNAWNY